MGEDPREAIRRKETAKRYQDTQAKNVRFTELFSGALLLGKATADSAKR